MTESSMDQSYQTNRQKIIFCGDAGVGKTSIINSIMGQKFSEEYEPSIGVDFFSKTVRYNNRLIKLQIWDSAGQEKFRSLIPNYIRGSALIFLIFDVSKKETYDHLNEWLKFITNITNIENSSLIIIDGNKLDLKDSREVNVEEAEKFCKDNKYDYFEVSAKDGTNIDNMLYTSLAGLPVFNVINGENIPRENIIKDLLQENLDSFRAQNYENGMTGNNTNTDNQNNNVSDINNINRINNNGLLIPNKKKKRKLCLC